MMLDEDDDAEIAFDKNFNRRIENLEDELRSLTYRFEKLNNILVSLGILDGFKTIKKEVIQNEHKRKD